MRGNALTKSGSLLFLAGIGLGFFGLFFSNFITSLGTVFLLLSILFQTQKIKHTSKEVYLIFLLPILFILTDFFRTSNIDIVSAKLLLAIGFAVIAISVYINQDSVRKHKKVLLIALVSTVLLVDVLSVGNYFLNKAELDALLLQSKSIPVIGGMHHIHFGILNALSIVALLYLILFSKSTEWYVFIALLLLLISFHILSSRTGLVSLYFALGISLLVYAIKEKAILKSMLGVIIVAIINFAALSLSTSFKNKVANSIEDIESWDEKEAVNFKSMGMRLEAYKTSVEIIKDHFFIGVGSGDSESVLQEYYIKLQTGLYKENRIGPHNQFLEYGIKYGLFGLLYMSLFFYCWIKWSISPLNYGLLTAVLVILISSQFESLMERQVSIFFTASILPIFQIAVSKEN